LPSIVVSLVLIDPLAATYDPLTNANDALAVVNTDAVDSSLVILALSEPDCKAKLADAVSNVVTLVEKDPDVTTKLPDTIANDALAVVSTDAVDSKLVNLKLLDPDC
jgi:hypothetical protein